MWQCPICERMFKSNNQSHMCTTKTIDDLFEGRSDELLLAFDKLLISVIDWEPCTVGPSTNTIVFTKQKAWLIVRPLRKELDIKFYHPTRIKHRYIFKTQDYGRSIAHHIRVSTPEEIDEELLSLLYKGYHAS